MVSQTKIHSFSALDVYWYDCLKPLEPMPSPVVPSNVASLLKESNLSTSLFSHFIQFKTKVYALKLDVGRVHPLLTQPPPTPKLHSIGNNISVNDIKRLVWNDSHETSHMDAAIILYLFQNTHLVNIPSPDIFLETQQVSYRSAEEQENIKESLNLIQSRDGQFTNFIDWAKQVIPKNRMSILSINTSHQHSNWINIIIKRFQAGTRTPSPYVTLFDHGILPHLSYLYQSTVRLSYPHLIAHQMLKDLGIITKDETLLPFMDSTALPHVQFNTTNSTSNAQSTIQLPISFKRRTISEKVYVIDDASAHELDDGLCLILPSASNLNYTLRILIAHPPAYLKWDDERIQEARKRGVSVYTTSRAYGMFDERFSANVDFRSGKEFLCFEVSMNEDGIVKHFDVDVVHVESVERYTYEQVDEILSQPSNNDTLHTLASLLKKHSNIKQRILVDKPTFYPTYTSEGIRLKRTSMTPARKMVAEGMLLTNALAGEFFQREDVPTFYRVQQSPWDAWSGSGQAFDYANMDSETYKSNLERMGASKHVPSSESIKELWKQILETKRGDEIDWMQHSRIKAYIPAAEYSVINTGHWGLSESVYTRMTSPLRRFTDLVPHFQIHAMLTGTPVPFSRPFLQEVSRQQTRLQKYGRRIENRTTRSVVVEWLRRALLSGNFKSIQPSIDERVIAKEDHSRDFSEFPDPFVSTLVLKGLVHGFKSGKTLILLDVGVEAFLDGILKPGQVVNVRVVGVEVLLGLVFVELV
jgi:hypothetical protein